MAGSYNHCVDHEGDGKLYDAETLSGMLDYTDTGDVYEAIEEMYGMIQLLAGGNPDRVEWARENYKIGLRLSGVVPFDEV